MEQSPYRVANWFSATQIPCNLWNQKVHYSIYKSLSAVPILSQKIQFMPLPSHFLNIHLNVNLPSMPGSSMWSVSLRFPHQNPVCTSPLPHTYYMSHPSHSSWSDLPNNILLRSSDHKAPHYVVFSSPLLPNSPHTKIFSSAPYFHHPQPTSLPPCPQCEWPSFTPIQNNRQNSPSSSLYFWMANWAAEGFTLNDSKHSMTSVWS